MDHLRSIMATVLLLSGGFAYSTDFGDSVDADPVYETVDQLPETVEEVPAFVDDTEEPETITDAFVGWGTLPDRSDVYGEVLNDLKAQQAADSRTLSQVKTQVDSNGKRLDELIDQVKAFTASKATAADVASSTIESWSPPVVSYSSGSSSGNVISRVVSSSPVVSYGSTGGYSSPVSYSSPVTTTYSQPTRQPIRRLFSAPVRSGTCVNGQCFN